MTVLPNDELSKILGGAKRDHRFDIFMWLFLYDYREAKFERIGCGGNSMRKMLAEHLRGNPDDKDYFLVGRDWAMVSDDELMWITGEKRQYEWLLGRLQRTTGKRLTPFFPNLHGRDLLIAMLDTWGVPLEEKIMEVGIIKENWIYHKKGDVKFKWFADENDGEKRCRFASDWLQKNDWYLAKSIGVFENYTELLICFDKKNLNLAELKLLLLNIRRGWNRKSSRERQVGKKQYNFILSNKVVECLDKLAEGHTLRRAQVLELLIKKEFEKGTYLTDWEKRFE